MPLALSSNIPRIAAFTHDPGSANAVGAVVAALRLSGARVDLYAAGPAKQRLELLGVDHHDVDDEMDLASAIERTEIVLAGTAQFNVLEQRAVETARALGIPSLVISDFWGNHDLRFRSRVAESKGRLLFPDYVTALDTDCAAELIEVGFLSEQVAISGQPHFGALLAQAQSQAQLPIVTEPRASSGPARSILFASQPMPGESEALELLTAAISGRGVRLTLRPHPRATNQAQLLAIMRRAGLPERLSIHAALSDDLAEHDVLIGMNSAVLIEAAIAGAVVARVARPEYAFPVQLDELVPPLRSTAEVIEFLDHPHPARQLPVDFVRQHAGADWRIARIALGIALETRRSGASQAA